MDEVSDDDAVADRGHDHAAPAASGPGPREELSSDGITSDMHTYQRRWPDDYANWPLPDVRRFQFAGPADVASYAEFDPVLAWRTWPDVWHLDGRGRFRCESRGSSVDSVRTFAAAPELMLDCRQTRLATRCPSRWLVIEPRHEWNDRYRPDEGDAAAFVALRHGLASHGVVLLDVMVFDQEHHWWSLHELTTGTTTWP